METFSQNTPTSLFPIFIDNTFEAMNRLVAGVAVAIFLSFIAGVLSEFVAAMSSASWAIVLGLLIGQIDSFRRYTINGTKWTEKYILQTAVVLLGAQISFSVMSDILLPLLGFIITGALLLAVAYFVLPRILGKDSKQLYWLIAGGESVCGSAAIASVSSTIGSKSEDTAGAIIGINLFSTIGLFLIPTILDQVNTSAIEDAVWTGGYLQSAGHAIGAGFALGEETGILATTLKLSRIVLLVPLVILSGVVFRSKDSKTEGKNSVNLPMFLWLFIGLVILTNALDLTDINLIYIKQLDKFLINVALAAIGMNINLKTLVKSGGKAIPAAIILTTAHLLILFILLHIW